MKNEELNKKNVCNWAVENGREGSKIVISTWI